MKIAAAQMRSCVGHASQNINRHLELIDLAVEHGADLVVFPELSLTGYEPSRAAEFAVTADDLGFAALQTASDVNAVTIVAGAPLKCLGLPQVSAFIFEPKIASRVYSKQFLHSDEIQYFAPGESADSLICKDPVVSLAICYELSVGRHAETAFAFGASVYLASVAKTQVGVRLASERLSSIAKRHSALVIMANGADEQKAAGCTGGSAAWGRDGNLIASLDRTAEAVVVVDDTTEQAVVATLP